MAGARPKAGGILEELRHSPLTRANLELTRPILDGREAGKLSLKDP